VPAIAEDRGVVGHAQHELGWQPADPGAPAFVSVLLGAAAQLHLHRPLRAGDFPGVAEAQPLVGLFHLPAVDGRLVEDAELVTDAVTERRDLLGGHRVEQARRQAPRAAVAQPRLFLLGENFLEIKTELDDRGAHRIVDPEVEQVISRVRAHQEFGRKIGHGARALRGVGRGGADPALQHAIAHRVREREIEILQRGDRGKPALDIKQVVQERALQRVLLQAGEVVLHLRRGGNLLGPGVHRLDLFMH